MKKNSLVIYGVIAALAALVIVLIYFVSRSFVGGSTTAPQELQTLSVQKGSDQFLLDRSGNAVWTIDGKSSSALWDRSKTDSFFDYIFATYGGSSGITARDDDELVNAVFSEGSGGGSGGGGGGSGDINQYFGSPTPTPNGGGGGGSSGGGGDDGSGGGGGDGGGPSWCQHWKLSYCADPPSTSPLPSSSPTPTPGGGNSGATPLPPDCSDPGNQQTGKTVIGNELCLPSPTPTP